MLCSRHLLRCSVHLQAIDSIPLVPQLGKLVARAFGGNTSGRSSGVQGKPPLSGWAKAQALMVYSAEHNERWVHNGFLQVLHPPSALKATGVAHMPPAACDPPLQTTLQVAHAAAEGACHAFIDFDACLHDPCIMFTWCALLARSPTWLCSSPCGVCWMKSWM